MLELQRQAIPVGVSVAALGYAENPGREIMLADMGDVRARGVSRRPSAWVTTLKKATV
jgi:hypothetical protein